MNLTFFTGVLATEALGQLALAAFFTLAFALGRRETEYLLFSLLCTALSIATAGVAFGYSSTTLNGHMLAFQIGHAGGILGAALNVQFAMRYARVKNSRKIVWGLYGFAGFYELANAVGWWWKPGSLAFQVSEVFGRRLVHARFDPTLIADSFYLLVAASLVASVFFLLLALTTGKREALSAVLGATLVGIAVINDVGLMTGKLPDTLYLLPHAFLLYAFCIASTLLLRYRVTSSELEHTVFRLQQRTEELRHSNAELRLLQDELVRKQQLAAVGELAAAIAHEVRNPLAIIVNAVAGLRRNGLKDEDRSMLLDIVDEETARLNRLVTDLLRFARPVSVKRSAVSLVELADRTRSVVRERHAVQIDVPDDPELQTVWVDPGLFRLVFDNLVENACQSMKGGGTVKIVVRRDTCHGTPSVRVDIMDTGHGMEADVLERATDPFFTTRPSGTGLGLPIVHRIMAAHGGELVLESELGTGTTASLFIPLGEPEKASNPPKASGSEKSLPPGTTKGRAP